MSQTQAPSQDVARYAQVKAQLQQEEGCGCVHAAEALTQKPVEFDDEVARLAEIVAARA
jgi:hypothetical protein